MVDLTSVSPGDIITSARQNLINDYIQNGTHDIKTSGIYIGNYFTMTKDDPGIGFGVALINITTLNNVLISKYVTDTGSFTLTNKTINGSNNTISNISLSTGVTGTLPITNGGTGATTQQAALDAITNSSSGSNGQVLTTDGTNASWQDSTGSSGASMVFERKIEGDLYTTTLMPIIISDELNSLAIKEVRLSLISLPTGASVKVDVRKNGTASTDSVFTSDNPIEVGTSQTATNGLYQVACDVSGARVGTPGTTLDSNRVAVASDDVLWIVITQVGSTLSGTDLIVNVTIN